MPWLLVPDLPEAPLAAAAAFYALLPGLLAEAEGQGALTLVFPEADAAHRGWRAEALASLAREAAPRRVNALVLDASADQTALAAAAEWLAGADAITGHLLQLDARCAG